MPRRCRSPRCLAGLQPAVHLRAARAWQDASPALRRQLRAGIWRRPDRPLRHREEFTNGFLAALAGRDLDAFKARFRGVDVLLIDDVQFLERKARTEEELFHTFNALYDAGSQLVITCDRLPGDPRRLEDRLRERFAAGLVTDIERPDLHTRLAILRKRANHDGVAVSDDALDLLASRVTTNVRALEGALIRLVAYGSLTNRALDRALAVDVLDRLGLPRSSALAPTIAEIRTRRAATSRSRRSSCSRVPAPTASSGRGRLPCTSARS